MPEKERFNPESESSNETLEVPVEVYDKILDALDEWVEEAKESDESPDNPSAEFKHANYVRQQIDTLIKKKV